MKYTVTIGGRTFEVVVNGDEVVLDGRVVAARLMAIPQTPLRQLVLDGQSNTFAIVNSEGEWSVSSAGQLCPALVEDERTRQLRQITGEGQRRQEGGVVKAPMPGLVVRVEVEPGQSVAPGTGVVVLEAMKMENEIRATGGGVVTAVYVKAGQAVEKGTPLVEVTAQG